MKRILAFGIIFMVAVVIGFFILRPDDRILPVFQPDDINPRLVDPSLQSQNKDHRVSDFRLVNQLGDTVGLIDLEGKAYVTDFFFTRCPTSCPK